MQNNLGIMNFLPKEKIKQLANSFINKENIDLFLNGLFSDDKNKIFFVRKNIIDENNNEYKLYTGIINFNNNNIIITDIQYIDTVENIIIDFLKKI